MQEKIKVRSTVLRQILSYEPTGLASILGVKTDATSLMRLGSMAHCYLLEKEKFNEYFAVYEGRKGSKSYQEAQDSKLYPVKEEDAETAKRMALVVERELIRFPKIARAFHDIKSKREFYLEHEDDSFLHTGRIDLYNQELEMLIDYKTTSYPVATKGLWSGEVDKRMYHLQMAYYKMLLKRNKYPVKHIYHVVQSMFSPYLVSVFSFSDDSIEIGERLAGSALVQIEYSLKEHNKIQQIYIEEEASSPYNQGFDAYID